MLLGQKWNNTDQLFVENKHKVVARILEKVVEHIAIRVSSRSEEQKHEALALLLQLIERAQISHD